MYSMSPMVGNSGACQHAAAKTIMCGHSVSPCETVSLFSPQRTEFWPRFSVLHIWGCGWVGRQAYFSLHVCPLFLFGRNSKTFIFKLSFYQLLKPGQLLGVGSNEKISSVSNYSSQNASQDICGIQKQIQCSRCGLIHTIPDLDYHLFC